MRSLRFAVVALLTALASITVLTSATAAGPPEYTVLALEGLEGDTWATGINEGGEVVGASRTPAGDLHAVLWKTSGAIVDLGTLGGAESFATAINNNGEVVGSSITTDGKTHAFLFKSGEMTDIGLASSGCDDGSLANAINDRGEVAGVCVPGGAAWHASVWQKGVVTELGAVGPPGGMSDARDINERGQVVGDVGSPRAVLWDDGVPMVLSDDYSYAEGINNAGDVAGWFSVGGPYSHAFLWASGTWQDLGVGQPTAINDRDQIVGVSWNETDSFPALWENGELRVLPSPGGGGAADINNRGQIVGVYWNGTSDVALLWQRTS